MKNTTNAVVNANIEFFAKYGREYNPDVIVTEIEVEGVHCVRFDTPDEKLRGPQGGVVWNKNYEVDGSIPSCFVIASKEDEEDSNGTYKEGEVIEYDLIHERSLVEKAFAKYDREADETFLASLRKS